MDLLQYLNLANNIGNGVDNAVGPNGVQAFKLSQSFQSTTTESYWDTLSQQVGTSFAAYVHLDRNYTGNILEWTSNTGSATLRIDIIKDTDDSRLLNIEFFNQSSKFQLLSPSEDFQNLSFTLRSGNLLSVYADCHLLHSIDLSQSVPAGANSQMIQIFQDASLTNMPVVCTYNITTLTKNCHLIFRLQDCSCLQ